MKQMKKIIYGFSLFVLCAGPLSATIPPGYYDAADGKKKEALKTEFRDFVL